jgi:hypothetical protein
MRNGGKHRTEATEVTEGEIVVGNPRIRSVTRWRLGENHAQRGKHRTEVTEGGWWLVAKNLIGDKVAAGRESCATGKHRTEAAEVTEGDGGW